jgi:hypothetical protein
MFTQGKFSRFSISKIDRILSVMKYKQLILLIILTISISCHAQLLNNSQATPYGIFKFSIQDSEAVNDLIKCCNKSLPLIADILKVRFDPNTIVEIFPDQTEYDRNIINKNLAGSPAISGYGKIQMVSPNAEIRVVNIPYQSRLMFIVHEYVHLCIDQINPSLPIFLNEGLACYYGSHDFYRVVVEKYIDQLTFKPSIEQLINNYDKIPGVDIYSFLFIDFLIKTEGQQNLLKILKNHSSINSRNSQWLKFLADISFDK